MSTAKEYSGDFAKYLDESDTVHDIALTIDGKELVLKVPTRARVAAYLNASVDSSLDPDAKTRAQWCALLGDKNGNRVMDHFDSAPFYEFAAFRKFVEDTWFGRGANEVEGK